MNKLAIAVFVLLLSSAAHARQMLDNTTFSFNVKNWTVWSGDIVAHWTEDGHYSLKGAALASGQENGVTAIAADCIEVTDWTYFAEFDVKASVKPSSESSEGSVAGISVYQYSDIACGQEVGSDSMSTSATADEWTAVSGSFALKDRVNSIRLVVSANGISSDGSVLFDDASLSIGRQAVEIFDNPHMSESPTGWLLYWGNDIEYIENRGHLTPNGSIRTEGVAPRTGSRGAFTGIRSLCVDVSERAPLDQFRVAASARPDMTAENPEMGIHVDYFSDTNCKSLIGSSLFFGDSYPGVWSRLEGTFVPPEGTRGILVLVRSAGVTGGGGATFDDVSLSLTQAVRQMWLVGVGDIRDQGIERFDMQYTRGGAFGGEFDATTIERETLVSLEVEFESCNSGYVNYRGEDLKGSYRIFRLAPNAPGEFCEETGFDMMSDDNSWMAGYWYGAIEAEGEGFAIDVMAGGRQAIVTWYTYQPTWGTDAPR